MPVKKVPCPACRGEIFAFTTLCPHCRKPVDKAAVAAFLENGALPDTEATSQSPQESIFSSIRQDTSNLFSSIQQEGSRLSSTLQNLEGSPATGDVFQDRNWILGMVGSAILFIGVFTPIISAPIVGSVNYFQNGKGDGVIVLILAVISVFITFSRKYRTLVYTGLLSLGITVFSFFNVTSRLSDMQDKVNIDLAGNPYRGLADTLVQSIQLQWGWAVLVIGAVMLMAAGTVKEKH